MGDDPVAAVVAIGVCVAACFASRVPSLQTRVIEYSNSVNSLSFWKYATGVEDARVELDEAAVAQHAMRRECKRMEHIANVFELQDQVRLPGLRGFSCWC